MGFPSEIQSNNIDCGATCLRIIALYYKKDFSLPYLHLVSETGIHGASLEGLSKAAKCIGFNTCAVKINFDLLITEAPLPLIAFFKGGHYVVVYKITSSKVYVSDPAVGLVNFLHADFISFWIGLEANNNTEEGIALLLELTRSRLKCE